MVPTVTCDHVFDVLTRGPFPRYCADDADVEAHLKVCYDCRHMAEALRPAVGLFHEAIETEEKHTLPRYRGQLEVARDELMGRVRTVEMDRRPPRNHVRRKPARFPTGPYFRASHIAIVPLLMIGLCAVLFSALNGSFSDSATRHPVSLGSAGGFQLDREGRHLLASLSLPLACDDVATPWDPMHPAHAVAGSSEINVRHYVCCTRCHAAGYEQRPRIDDVATVSRACGACHQSL